MYNEVQKKEFIRAKSSGFAPSTLRLIVLIFKKLSPLEEQWGGDVITQPAANIKTALDTVSGVRRKSSQLIFSFIKEYAKWAEQKGYPVNKELFDLEINNAEKIRQQMVPSPAGLLDIMKRRTVVYDGKEYTVGFDSPEKETTDVIYRTFLWLAFSGLKDTDAIHITVRNVSFKARIIVYREHIYHMYEESVRDFEKACTLERFLYEHANYTTFKDRAQGELILRGMRSERPDLSSIRPIITKKLCVPSAQERFSYNKIYLSGVFYRTYLAECEGTPPDFRSVIQNRMQGKQYTQSQTRTMNTITNRYVAELNDDYNEWKEVFYPKTPE